MINEVRMRFFKRSILKIAINFIVTHWSFLIPQILYLPARAHYYNETTDKHEYCTEATYVPKCCSNGGGWRSSGHYWLPFSGLAAESLHDASHVPPIGAIDSRAAPSARHHVAREQPHKLAVSRMEDRRRDGPGAAGTRRESHCPPGSGSSPSHCPIRSSRSATRGATSHSSEATQKRHFKNDGWIIKDVLSLNRLCKHDELKNWLEGESLLKLKL